MAVVHVNDQDFGEKVLKSDKPVVVDFFAEWCGPCKMAAPVIEELSTQYEGKLVMAKLDVDQAQETASQFGVMSIPTMIVFKDGKEIDRKVGFGGKAGVEAMIQKVLE